MYSSDLIDKQLLGLRRLLGLLEHFVLLVPLALLFELVEPAFGDLVRHSIDHPLGKTAHNVQAIDEEDVGHVLLEGGIETPTENKPDDNEVGPDPLGLLWHFFGVRRKALHKQGAHTWLWEIWAEVLTEVEVAIGDGRRRLKGVVYAPISSTWRLMEHAEVVQVGVPSRAPLIIDGCVEH